MTVLLLLFILGSISFFIPYKNIKIFFVLAAIILSGLFFFYAPPVSDDLYRYYQLFDTIEHLSLRAYFDGEYGTQDWLINYMLNDYKGSALIFSSVMFVVSRTGIKEILPFVFSLITYIPLFMLVYEVCTDNKYSKRTMCLCFVLLLSCIDFRFVSCLRNLSAYSIFVYTLYKDTVKKSKPLICIIGYLVACGIHLACVPLVIMRFLAIAVTGRFKWGIVVALLFIRRLALLIASLLNIFFGGNFLISQLVKKIQIYFVERTSYNSNGALFFCAVIIIVAFIYFALKKDRVIPKVYKKYEAVYLYSAAFTVGCIGQYDILMRNCELVVILAIPFVLHFINGRFVLESGNIRIISSYQKLYRDVIICVCFVGLVLISFLFYTLFSYIPMDVYFWR